MSEFFPLGERPTESDRDETSNPWRGASFCLSTTKGGIEGEFTEKVKGGTNEAIGNAKQESGNPDTRAEGEAQENKGELQEDKGTVEGAVGNDI